MTDLVVQPATAPLRGTLPCPPDRATAELACLLGALGQPGRPSRLRAKGLARLTAEGVLPALGVELERDEGGLSVIGLGPQGLRAPDGPLDLGRGSWLMAALSGVLAGSALSVSLEGDPEVMAGCMAQIAAPLRHRGAQIEGRLDPRRVGEMRPPIAIAPSSAPLSMLQWQATSPGYPGKVAALASGILAQGETLVHEPVASRDRFERLLNALGMPVESGGAVLRGRPVVTGPEGFDEPVPGDSDVGLALLAAGLLVRGSQVGVRGIASSPSCEGTLKALDHARASLHVAPRQTRLGEATADVTAYGAPALGLRLGGERAACAGASLPTLVALAAACSPARPSELFDLPPGLDHPARLERTLAMIEIFGLEAMVTDDGLAVVGRGEAPLRAGDVDAQGDPALAMAACVMALRADGPCRVRRADCIVESAPRFVASLRALGATIDVQP